MARPKKPRTTEGGEHPDIEGIRQDNSSDPASGKPEKPKRVLVRAKHPDAWKALLQKVEKTAWRKLRVTLQVRDRLLAGKPASLDAANAMLKARGLEDQIAAVADIVDLDLRAKAAEKIATDEGLCEFSRRPGKPGIWMPSNNIKACIKENWSVLGLRVKVRGSRGALAEGMFVCGIAPDHVDKNDKTELDWIYLGMEPAGVLQAVSHTVGPTGPVSSIKRHEYVERPSITFDMIIATATSVDEKISDDELAQMFIHASEHGLGACRSQGYGRFDIIRIEQLGEVEEPATEEQQSA